MQVYLNEDHLEGAPKCNQQNWITNSTNCSPRLVSYIQGDALFFTNKIKDYLGLVCNQNIEMFKQLLSDILNDTMLFIFL